MNRWGDIKDRIVQSAASSGCDEQQARDLTCDAVSALTDVVVCIGSYAEIKIKTMTDRFALPYGFERAIEVHQCDEYGGLAQGWQSITNDHVYLDPEKCGDSSIIDLGLLPYDQAPLGKCQIGIRPELATDSVLATVYASLRGVDVKWEPSSENGAEVWSNFEIDNIFDLRKNVTTGRVRFLARDSTTGAVYVLAIAYGEEQQIARRHYRYPEIVQGFLSIRSITTGTSGAWNFIQIDTNTDNVNLQAGASILLTGWETEGLNGLWTVAASQGSSVYIHSQFVPEIGVISSIGYARLMNCMDVSALRARLPITSDDSIIPVRNINALRLAVTAMSMYSNGTAEALANAEQYMKTAIAMLQAEVARYGADPTNALRRKAQYQFDLKQYVAGSLGYTRARIALDIPGAIGIGKSDITRLINEAEESIVMSGKYGDTIQSRKYKADETGKIVCEPDVQAFLTASYGGTPVDLRDQLAYPQDERMQSMWANPIASWQFDRGQKMVPMYDCGVETECGGKRCKIYWVPVSCCNASIRASVKLRHVPLIAPADMLRITNYPAIKLMTEALIAKGAKDFTGFRVLQGESFALLNREKSESRGGATGTINNSPVSGGTGMGVNTFR